MNERSKGAENRESDETHCLFVVVVVIVVFVMQKAHKPVNHFSPMDTSREGWVFREDCWDAQIVDTTEVEK